MKFDVHIKIAIIFTLLSICALIGVLVINTKSYDSINEIMPIYGVE